ncbi:DUF599 domain-containing protein [Caulobacter vibrioides]|uniref:DUF599 domain-containing protein n=2 Tax=Caulobacter vibrioides TaxID=155892 RepID=Q9A9H0_CAUVC|nr:DUF599 domain-containing protein [Caulobacter vibrioides]YP_002516443.1 hypothetical protein CCNA_01070 [Caulobacter vibrioides NA1000]AAK23002.1 hypothetical protein CC_1018 [Caulobacter vibrioides CB15]ACL94535.1 hypothetical protein CCNA_01070 [Caulobacter vibrioides NA1000]ATC23970.1 DUF599 domain-containing protein [Caulobacter vibrioides]ATC27852.1 DUF599 domain-containing protein [Caulobacter vibrioides]AZH12213.1 DUF599 domain-containing protein [Caulobacter vibrioides]
MPLLDILAVTVFACCWLLYEPMLKRIGESGAVLNTDMTVIRRRWMQEMAVREIALLDGQLLGHAINSASFFASSNLILIAAAAGVLFGGDNALKSVEGLAVLAKTTPLMFQIKLGLVLVALARGLLDFIWSIRQMNYCLAAIGATPMWAPNAVLAEYAEAAGGILNPALSAFNAGVRAYYFALAAAVWLLGPLPFLTATLGAMLLLLWRQRRSSASVAVRKVRQILERQPVVHGPHLSRTSSTPPEDRI